MKTFPIILFIMTSAFWGRAQSIAKTDALIDITFLNDAVKYGHPVNYNPEVEKITLDNILLEINSIKKDSLTRLEFRLLLNEAIFKIGCVHTSIAKLPQSINTKQKFYFPQPIYLVEGKLVDSLKREVSEINGINAQVLIEDFENFYPSDGATKALSTLAFNKNSAVLISAYFDYTQDYSLSLEGKNYSVKGIEKLPEIDQSIDSMVIDVIFTDNDNSFYLHNGLSILRIQHFDKGQKTFIKKTFSYLKTHNNEKLIIDLRDNLGGNRKSAIYLCQHLISNPFGYSIVRPNLSPEKYLNDNGRFLLFLSKIKYNAGKIFSASNSKPGKFYNYEYKPKKKSYSGQIYVITNGFTASSSTMVTSWLKQYTNAKFTGSQSAGGYNGNNGGSFPTLTLPQSKYEITFPIYRLIFDINSNKRDGIIPDNTLSHIIGDDVDVKEILKVVESNAKKSVD